MPTNTPNLNLIKPLVSEHYDVVVANANNDILDTAVGGLAPQATTYTKTEVDTQVGLLAPKANPVFTGTQTLPNIVTNNIKFPATPVPSADANTLDDYEEGTFNPTVIGSTTAGTATYIIQYGYYTKIGNRVFFDIYVRISAHTGAGNLNISLPFASGSSTEYRHAVTVGYVNSFTVPAGSKVLAVIQQNSQYVDFFSELNGNSSALALDSSFSIILSGSYQAN